VDKGLAHGTILESGDDLVVGHVKAFGAALAWRSGECSRGDSHPSFAGNGEVRKCCRAARKCPMKAFRSWAQLLILP
jgi:hypothetical protein